ncbi:hypothetical protein IJI76_01455 [Candidatus Saccharibacteria bacterium]|nr:hypothetical protein [Candidatus Saccharibacteria bacterium]
MESEKKENKYGIAPGLMDDSDSSSWGNKMKKRADAKKFAKLAEEGADKTGSNAGKDGVGNNSFTSAVKNAKDAEGGTGFANNVQGKTLEQVASNTMPGGKMFVKQAKKFGPLGTILIIIVTLVGIFSGVQSLMAFGLVANGLDQFNTLRTSMNKRSTYFTRFSMQSDRNVKATRASIFGKEKFKISNSLSKKLQKNGVYYKEEGGVRFLVYEDSDGKAYAIAANDDDVGRLPSSTEVPDGKGGTKHIEISDGGKMKIDDVFEVSSNFRNSFDKGTRTMKGHVAGWFDGLSDKVHNWLGNSRNRFRESSEKATDEDIRTMARKGGMNEDLVGDEGTTHTNDGYAEDGNGNRVEVGGEDHPGGETVKKSDILDNPGSSKVRTSSNIEAKVKSIAGGTTGAANVACIVSKIFSAVNAAIAAIHIANVVNYVTGFLEAVQGTQAGDLKGKELSYYMTNLSKKGNTYDLSGEEVLSENKSALESVAISQFFSDGTVKIQANDKIAKKFNAGIVAEESIANSAGKFTNPVLGDVAGAFSSATTAAASYKTCLYFDIAAAAAGELLEIALAFFTGGVGNVIKGIIEKIGMTILTNAITVAIMAVFSSTILPHIAQLMTMDLISNMAGEDAAYAINSGFNIYAGKEMQISSGLPATKETLMAHYRVQQEVIASEAEFERSERSPFDPTSKYTFVGSIVNSLIPIASTWSSPLMTISKTANTVGSSIRGLLPTANADGEVILETSINENCANSGNIGIVGDAFCTSYFVTDTSTIAADPSDVMDRVMNSADHSGGNGNFKWENVDDEQHNGNPDINANSELGRWVVSCATRQSQFGIVDSNVADAVSRLVRSGNDTLDSAISTGVGVLPVVGDILQITEDVRQLDDFGWLTGENCIKEEYKYYSRYSEDQRLMEAAGIIEESAVSKFLDEYYAENPLDNSYEGIIARYSGMTKEQVSDLFDILEYYEYVANYNPEGYGPEFHEKEEYNFNYESNEIIAKSDEFIVDRYVVYDDLRTKTKVA